MKPASHFSAPVMFTNEDKAKLLPLQLNEATGEPYLQLPSPHDNIRITPLRHSDEAMVKTYMNDPRIYEFLAGPPFPYTQDNAIDWISRSKTRADAVFSELLSGNEFVGGCPVRTIREVQDDGTETFLGDVSIDREDPDAPWVHESDAENSTKLAGDPTIIWSIGGRDLKPIKMLSHPDHSTKITSRQAIIEEEL